MRVPGKKLLSVVVTICCTAAILPSFGKHRLMGICMLLWAPIKQSMI